MLFLLQKHYIPLHIFIFKSINIFIFSYIFQFLKRYFVISHFPFPVFYSNIGQEWPVELVVLSCKVDRESHEWSSHSTHRKMVQPKTNYKRRYLNGFQRRTLSRTTYPRSPKAPGGEGYKKT